MRRAVDLSLPGEIPSSQRLQVAGPMLPSPLSEPLLLPVGGKCTHTHAHMRLGPEKELEQVSGWP